VSPSGNEARTGSGSNPRRPKLSQGTRSQLYPRHREHTNLPISFPPPFRHNFIPATVSTPTCQSVSLHRSSMQSREILSHVCTEARKKIRFQRHLRAAFSPYPHVHAAQPHLGIRDRFGSAFGHERSITPSLCT
jgi:hypothetical protein